MHLKIFWLLILLLLGTSVQAQPEPVAFIVTITNMAGFAQQDNTGVARMPASSAEAGPALPGDAYEFTVTALPGDSLSFATMLAESNDLFFAPDVAGIALYDEVGTPIDADVTDQIGLWDAGTEVNQPIGVGDQQAPRQAAPNTGTAENGVVQRIDSMTDYPAVADIINVRIAGTPEGIFTVRIENVSDTTPTPIMPVVWAVSQPVADGVFFTPGEPDRGDGLEALAEDGNPAALASVLNGADYLMPLTAVVWVLHGDTQGSGPFFTSDEPDRGDGLEALAEDGSVFRLTGYLEGTDYPNWGVASVPDMEAGAGPLIPGNFYTIFIDAVPGERLSFVSRFEEGNDLFFAPDAPGIALFTEDGQPVDGTFTRHVHLWDAGTEVNEEPRVGANQGPRQPEPNTGADEMGTVRRVDDGYSYPAVPAFFRITIHPND